MKKIAFKYGLRMLAGFALLFAVIHLMGFGHVYHLRILNGFIHLTFIYLAIRDYRREYPGGADNYMSGVAVGMYTSAIAVALFTVAMCSFLSLNVNSAFFGQLKAQAPMPEYFTPFTASLFIFVEGIVVSLIGSYLVTRVLDAQQERTRR